MFAALKRAAQSATTIAMLVVPLPINAGFAQVLPRSLEPTATAPSYPDLADLFAAAPLILRARIASAIALKGQETSAGTTRFYVEADVTTLIRGSGGVSARVAYVVDLTPDSRGKLPRLKKADMLIAAQPVAGRPGTIQLIARDSQLPWTAALDARVRALVAAVMASDAPPIVTGVASAYHVAGSIPGEGETQIFLSTATGAPISLTILRRPGEAPRWALALGEIVDEAAAVPARDSLAWYRLACFLPRGLPEAATAALAESDVAAARTDYALVMRDLGMCPRSRTRSD